MWSLRSPPLGPTQVQLRPLWTPPSSHRDKNDTHSHSLHIGLQFPKAKGWLLTGTPSMLPQLTGHGRAQPEGLVSPQHFFSPTPFSAAQPISLMRRQEREPCLKLTSKTQNAVWKENQRPHAPGGAEHISGVTQHQPQGVREHKGKAGIVAARDGAKATAHSEPPPEGGTWGVRRRTSSGKQSKLGRKGITQLTQLIIKGSQGRQTRQEPGSRS